MTGCNNNVPVPSFINRIHRSNGAHMSVRNNMLLPAIYPSDRQNFKLPSLVDLSPLPRWGIQGEDAKRSLEKSCLAVPARNGVAENTEDYLTVSFQDREFLILGHPIHYEESTETVNLECVGRSYDLPYRSSHFWYAVSGAVAPAMFAEFCELNLDKDVFANKQSARTMMAMIPAIVVRWDVEATPFYHVLGDSSYSEYFWDCLSGAVKRIGGQVLGLDQLISHFKNYP